MADELYRQSKPPKDSTPNIANFTRSRPVETVPPATKSAWRHVHRSLLAIGGLCLATSGWLEFKTTEATARCERERTVWRLSLFVELMLAAACVLHVFIVEFWRRCVPKKFKSCEFSAQPEGCSGWPCAKVGSVVCLSVVLLASSYSATAEVWWDSCTREPVWAATTCAQIIFHFVWSLTVLMELDALRLIACNQLKVKLKTQRGKLVVDEDAPVTPTQPRYPYSRL